MKEFILKHPLKDCLNCGREYSLKIWGFKCPLCKASFCSVCWIGDPDGEGGYAFCPVCMGKANLPPVKEKMLVLTF